jgi:hypothetical protein
MTTVRAGSFSASFARSIAPGLDSSSSRRAIQAAAAGRPAIESLCLAVDYLALALEDDLCHIRFGAVLARALNDGSHLGITRLLSGLHCDP